MKPFLASLEIQIVIMGESADEVRSSYELRRAFEDALSLDWNMALVSPLMCIPDGWEEDNLVYHASGDGPDITVIEALKMNPEGYNRHMNLMTRVNEIRRKVFGDKTQDDNPQV